MGSGWGLRGQVPFHPTLPRVHAVTMTAIADVDLGHLAEVFIGFLRGPVTAPPQLPSLSLWEEHPCVQPLVVLHLLQGGASALGWNSARGICLSSPCTEFE